MSLEDEVGRQASLRALAHPVRLQMLSLLTGAALTAADIGRELGLTHANASYHLRKLLAAGMIVQAGEERIRGGVAKRYRYDAERDRDRDREVLRSRDPHTHQALFAAVANELTRRVDEADWSVTSTMTDAELWVDPEVWREIRDRITQASRDLHDAAQAPHTPGTIRTSTTIALFRLGES